MIHPFDQRNFSENSFSCFVPQWKEKEKKRGKGG
jgi:hypothetical protein